MSHGGIQILINPGAPATARHGRVAPALALAAFLSVLPGLQTAARAATPKTLAGLAFPGGCALAAGRTPTQADLVPSQPSMTITTPNGPTDFTTSCDAADFFTFGAGLEQAFTGEARSNAFMHVDFGVVRALAEVGAAVQPAAYGTGFVSGMNPYHAMASAGVSGSWVEVVTPPPTATAPNPGDASSIKLWLHLDCHEQPEDSTRGATYSTVIVDVYTVAAYDAQQAYYDYSFFKTWEGSRVECPVDILPPKEVAVTVGQPIVVVGGLVVQAGMREVFSGFPSGTAFVNDLNTATVMLTTGPDDTPIVGQSGHVYGPVGALPTITTTTTSTSTTLQPTTTTVPPGCTTTCGDGVVDAACDEECDCPPTADPITAAYGCAGSAVIPPQSTCAICRGCRLDRHLCVVSVTTTTTPSNVTTTTVPASCLGLTGLHLARCALDAALASPLCGAEHLPAKLDHALRAKLGAVSTLVGRAADATGSKVTKALKHAHRRLEAVGRASGSAAHSKSAKRRISGACAATIAELVTQTEGRLSAAGP